MPRTAQHTPATNVILKRVLTRERFLAEAGLAALSASGLYGLLDGTVLRPGVANAAVGVPPPEQHLLRGVRTIADNGIAVLVPPIYHQVVTAELRVEAKRSELLDARAELERALRRVDERFAPTPAGLGVTVAWGESYFRRYVPRLAATRLPIDRRASAAAGAPVPALLAAVRFPSDPADVVLEQNDLCFLFRSDSLRNVSAGAQLVLGPLGDLLRITSVRKGFVGGGLPKRMALRAGVPGADSIPEGAQLFLGFTSTQKAALGPDPIANLETLPGLTDQWPAGYFRHGTTMHLSHLFEDLRTWYETFTYTRRVWAAFRPGVNVADGTQTVPQGAADLETESEVLADGARDVVGHSGTIQPAARLEEETRDNHGAVYPRGTSTIQRADFNTLDNPFFWSARPSLDGLSAGPAAGLHFVAFAPTVDTFNRARLAMDGRYADSAAAPADPRSEKQGFNSVLRTTHRQNFLVPPRRHRSFPLAELL